MKTLRWTVAGAIALLVFLLTFGGCYTQFGSSRDEGGLEYVVGEDDQMEQVSDEAYYDARERFYNESYYVGYSLGFGFAWAFPPYGWSMYPYTYPGGGYYPVHGVHAPVSVARVSRAPVTARNFGPSRTMGVGHEPVSTMPRQSSGYVPLPSGVRQSGSVPPSTGTAVQRGFSGGRRGTESERRAPATSPLPQVRIEARPSGDVTRPRSDPSSGSSTPNPWGTPGVGARPSERPGERSAPPPSQSAPSGNSKGNDSRGSGNTRGGDRR